MRVDYGRTVGDGQYGSERLTVGITATLDGPLDPNHPFDQARLRDIAADLTQELRSVVLEELKHSPSEGVRQALETREEREARWDRERDELQRGGGER